MRVKIYTQVFSLSVGAALHLAARKSAKLHPDDEYYIIQKAADVQLIIYGV